MYHDAYVCSGCDTVSVNCSVDQLLLTVNIVDRMNNYVMYHDIILLVCYDMCMKSIYTSNKN